MAVTTILDKVARLQDNFTMLYIFGTAIEIECGLAFTELVVDSDDDNSSVTMSIVDPNNEDVVLVAELRIIGNVETGAKDRYIVLGVDTGEETVFKSDKFRELAECQSDLAYKTVLAAVEAFKQQLSLSIEDMAEDPEDDIDK